MMVPLRLGHFFRSFRRRPSTLSEGRTKIFTEADSVVKDLTSTWNLSSAPDLNPSAKPALVLTWNAGGAKRGSGLGQLLMWEWGLNTGDPETTAALKMLSRRPGRPTRPLSFLMSNSLFLAPAPSSSLSSPMLSWASTSSTG